MIRSLGYRVLTLSVLEFIFSWLPWSYKIPQLWFCIVCPPRISLRDKIFTLRENVSSEALHLEENILVGVFHNIHFLLQVISSWVPSASAATGILVLLIAREVFDKGTVLSWWPEFLSAVPPAIWRSTSEAPLCPPFQSGCVFYASCAHANLYSTSQYASGNLFAFAFGGFLGAGIGCAFQSQMSSFLLRQP